MTEYINKSKHFNSNMVWLKVNCIFFNFSFFEDFNSNMVWLKGWVASWYSEAPHHFNSNMVWLKDKKQLETKQKLIVFQFQYGLIKSKYVGSECKICEFLFQFQYGLIKRSTPKVSALISEIFQFQYGLIKR